MTIQKNVITILFMLLGLAAMAQIRGNKSIETKTFDISNVERIRTNLYAKITIDQSAKEQLTITADSNLFDHIGRTVEDGELHIDQLKWIAPSQDIFITIGAPNIRRLEQGTHDTTKIVNLNNDYLQVMAPIGTVIIEGQTKELRLGTELATIDASKTEANEVYVNLWSYGQIIVNPKTKLWGEISNDGKLFYRNKPDTMKVKSSKGAQVLAYETNDELKNPEAQYIKFKIKNNSKNRHNFYVVGPKPDGSRFSDGFPMMPNTKRHENWTVGTKIYKVNSLGFRKFLVEIKKENEGDEVNLF